ncbi:LuxR C-terminal-related transcriptional regulator [Paenibacillus sp. NPDC058071]|uniref:LuxR C-terminal-related transcriptional regulator n=1 Tax=Paenibacillus sp. NPDC058071 TaxID=3346326 RepID=UPI0036DC889A
MAVTEEWEESVLQSKIYLPRLSGNEVFRIRLMSKLDTGGEIPLTLITAPAGFGKTTLASSWVHSRSVEAAWYSLDESDNDPIRFWSHLISAIEQHGGFGERLQPAKKALRSSSMETAVSLLLNEMDRNEKIFHLVLDDYHVITNKDVQESLAFFTEHLPARSRLLLLSRTIPNLPLPRLRVSKQLLHIDANELRFTIDEADELQKLSLEKPMPLEDLARLEQKTEGWAAGLLLAFLSVDKRSDVSAFIDSFSGSHRYVIDYLVDEVLNRQEGELQRFLLQLSVLDRFCPSLADAVTERSDSSEQIIFLEKAHMFLVPLDDSRKWYRFHHLFGEMLRRKLNDYAELEHIEELHQRAHIWFEENDFYSDAIEHAIKAKDYESAASYMDRHLPSLIKNGSEASLLRWIKELPLGEIAGRPDLFYYLVGTLAAGGRSLEAQNWLDRTLELLSEGHKQLSSDTRRKLKVGSELYRASVAYYRGDIDSFIELVAVNVEELEHFPPIVKVVNLGEAMLHRGPIGFGGRLGKMAYLSQRIAADNQIRQAMQYMLQGHGVVFLADFMYEKNKLEEARQMIEAGFGGIQRSEDNLGVVTPGTILLSKILQALGEWNEAEQLLRTMIAEMEPFSSPHWQLMLEARFVRMRLSKGDVDQGLRWSERRRIQPDSRVTVEREYELITLARLLLKLKRNEPAIHLLRQLERNAIQSDRLGSRIEILILLALVYHCQGNAAKAGSSLEIALQLAEPEGYVRIFLDEGEPLAEMLTSYLHAAAKNETLENDALYRYASELFAAFEAESAGLESASSVERMAVPGARSGDSGEQVTGASSAFDVASGDSTTGASSVAETISLTKRELQILCLIAEGRTNAEIGEALFVSPGTIKRYSHNLYQKLRTKNRVQAVSRARELNLL